MTKSKDAPAPTAEPVSTVDNGNIFIFCDYVDDKRRGCARGAGHNGPHAVCFQPYPQSPVLLVSAAPPERVSEGKCEWVWDGKSMGSFHKPGCMTGWVADTPRKFCPFCGRAMARPAVEPREEPNE